MRWDFGVPLSSKRNEWKKNSVVGCLKKDSHLLFPHPPLPFVNFEWNSTGKRAAEALCMDYHRQHNVPCTVGWCPLAPFGRKSNSRRAAAGRAKLLAKWHYYWASTVVFSDWRCFFRCSRRWFFRDFEFRQNGTQQVASSAALSIPHSLASASSGMSPRWGIRWEIFLRNFM